MNADRLKLIVSRISLKATTTTESTAAHATGWERRVVKEVSAMKHVSRKQQY